MKAEDKILSQFIDKHRLGEWLGFAWQAARSEIENEADSATQNGNGATAEDTAMSGITNKSLDMATQPKPLFGTS